MKRGKKRLLIGAVAAGATLMVVGCGRKDPPRGAPPPPEVTVVKVEPETVPETFEFPGEVEAYRRVDVRARVGGIVVARRFVEGSEVRRGRLLYQVDTVRYAAAYRSALAQLRNTRATYERMRPLLAQHAVAQQDVDNARTAYLAAQAALDEARKDLDDTHVRAEIAGRVGQALVDVGDRITGPADLLTTIDRLDPVYVTFQPSSDQLREWQSNPGFRALIQPGSSLAVQVMLPDSTVLPDTGRLDFVAPSLNAATGTEEFRAVLPNHDRALMPGEFVRVRLVGFRLQNALAVPQRAVLMRLGQQFVYVVGAGDTATVRDVQTGRWSGSLWIIEKGLKPGDRVVVDGVQKVVPGRPVTPVPQSGGAPADSAATERGAGGKA